MQGFFIGCVYLADPLQAKPAAPSGKGGKEKGKGKAKDKGDSLGKGKRDRVRGGKGGKGGKDKGDARKAEDRAEKPSQHALPL